MTRNELPPVELLDILFDYKEGHLIRKIQMGKYEPGTIVEGTLTENGYKNVTLFGISYRQHRVIWKMIHREEPPEMIDHINRVKTDNRIENLRVTDYSLNYQNSDQWERVLAAKAKRLEPEEGRRRAKRMPAHHLKRLREQLGMA